MKSVPLSKGRLVKTPWLSIDEAAAYCGFSREVFIRQADAKECPFSGAANNRRYHAEQLDRMMFADKGEAR